MNATFKREIAALELAGVRLEEPLKNAAQVILKRRGKVVVTGLGKSGIVARKIAATLSSTGTPAVFVSAGEALHGDLGMISHGDVVLMLSKSGTTAELLAMIAPIRKVGGTIVGFVGTVGSALWNACDIALDMTVEQEACPLGLAPTTSTTVMLVAGDAVAIEVMVQQRFTERDFANFHPGGALGKRLTCRVCDVMNRTVPPPYVYEDALIKDAIAELGRANLGAVCVLKGETNIICGILTEADVRRMYIACTPLQTNVRDVMTRDPRTIREDALTGDALAIMERSDRQVYVLPVTRIDGTYAGMIRMHDIVR